MSSLDGHDIGHATDVARLDHIPTTLSNLARQSSRGLPRAVTYRKRTSLPPGYKPGEFDVCCGRGKRHWNHAGNVRFRRHIQSNVERYMDAPSKNDKTAVVVSIVDDIRQLGGCFLKEDLRGNWYDIGDQQAREKVGHSLRDQVSTIHRQKQKQLAVQQFQQQQAAQQAAGGGGQALAQAPIQITVPPRQVPAANTVSPVPLQQPPPQQSPTRAPQSTAPPFPEPMVLNDNGAANDRNASDRSSVSLSAIVAAVDQSMYDPRGSIDVSLLGDLEAEYQDEEEEDEGALSDGSNERIARREELRSSSRILDKFARRPSFASAVADPTSSFSTTKSSSKRSSGWSFLNDLDFGAMESQWDWETQQQQQNQQNQSSLRDSGAGPMEPLAYGAGQRTGSGNF